MKKKMIYFATFFIISILSLSIFVLNPNILNLSINSKPLNKIILSADRVKYYNDIADLKNDSNYIIEAKTYGTRESFGYKGVIFSIMKARVTDSFKISNLKPGDEINILETGGELNGNLYTLAGDSLLDSNKSYILFMNKYEGPVTQKITYVIKGINQGKYNISNDKVQSIGDNKYIDDKIKSLNSKQFRDLLR